MSGDEPLTHIARPPLPWRDSGLTICGKPVTQYADGLVVNIADARAAVRRLGKSRFAMTHCMTCANNADRWWTWEENPGARMAREIGYLGMTKAEPIIHTELRVMALLIERYRDEFDEMVEAHASGGVVTMQELRRRRSRGAS